MTQTNESRPPPTGWIATAVGGVIGGGIAGVIGLLAAFAYFDSQPIAAQDLGDLAWAAIFGAICGYLGGAFGAAGALRLRGYHRQIASGFLFASLVAVAMVLWGYFGLTLSPDWDEEAVLVVVLAATIPLAAWISRRTFTLDEEA